MDAERFDTLARTLTAAGSRRRALAALGGALGLLGWRTGEDAEAHNAKDACKNKSGKAKKKCLKKAKKHNAAHANEAPPPPPPPPPTCTDGIKNGTETDVDCGGSCGRCANQQRCLTFRDCESAVCAPNGTCQSCEDLAGECPDGCFCGNQGICANNTGSVSNPVECSACPEGTVHCAFSQGEVAFICSPRCGTTF